MKTYFTLAVLIPATLALGACSNAPTGDNATAFNRADPTTWPYPVRIGNIGLIGLGSAVRSMGSIEFEVPAMVVTSQRSNAMGVRRAFAYFHADAAGMLKVIAREGKLRVTTSAAMIGAEAADLAAGHSPEQGVTLRAGWYLMDVQCLSDQCGDVVATFNGKPIIPYALPSFLYHAASETESSPVLR